MWSSPVLLGDMRERGRGVLPGEVGRGLWAWRPLLRSGFTAKRSGGVWRGVTQRWGLRVWSGLAPRGAEEVEELADFGGQAENMAQGEWVKKGRLARALERVGRLEKGLEMRNDQLEEWEEKVVELERVKREAEGAFKLDSVCA